MGRHVAVVTVVAARGGDTAVAQEVSSVVVVVTGSPAGRSCSTSCSR